MMELFDFDTSSLVLLGAVVLVVAIIGSLIGIYLGVNAINATLIRIEHQLINGKNKNK